MPPVQQVWPEVRVWQEAAAIERSHRSPAGVDTEPCAQQSFTASQARPVWLWQGAQMEPSHRPLQHSMLLLHAAVSALQVTCGWQTELVVLHTEPGQQVMSAAVQAVLVQVAASWHWPPMHENPSQQGTALLQAAPFPLTQDLQVPPPHPRPLQQGVPPTVHGWPLCWQGTVERQIPVPSH
jgi:hypothetical protein